MTQDTRRASQPVIAGIGEVLWDVLPGGKQLGGAPANFAYHAKALGADGVVVSRVGDDDLGREILARLDGLGVDRQYVGVDRDHPTGTVDVRLDGGGVPDYVIRRDVAWDFLPEDPALLGAGGLAGRVDAVCYGTLGQRGAVSRATIGRFLSAVRPGCLRVFDVNLRQDYFDRDLIHGLLQASDVVKLNDEELPVVARLLGLASDESSFIESVLRRYGLKLVALTRGGRGSRLSTDGQTSLYPGFPTHVADTVGAGDSFTAALTIGLLRGYGLDRINAAASRLASYVCSQNGATPPIRAEWREM